MTRIIAVVINWDFINRCVINWCCYHALPRKQPGGEEDNTMCHTLVCGFHVLQTFACQLGDGAIRIILDDLV